MPKKLLNKLEPTMRNFTGDEPKILASDKADFSLARTGAAIAAILVLILLTAILTALKKTTVHSTTTGQQLTIVSPQEQSSPTKDLYSAESHDIDATASLEQSFAPTGATGSYTVVSVVDGDTFKINYQGKLTSVRMIGIDTPETVHPSKPAECYGSEASTELKTLLTGKTVILESDSTQSDVDYYGRLLRYVWLDGENINEHMIRYGYAYEYTYSTPYRYQSRFQQAEKDAELTKIGLWSACRQNICSLQ